MGESGDKPSLRPIGTERASRRVSASPLPSVPGISPLIGTGTSSILLSYGVNTDLQCTCKLFKNEIETFVLSSCEDHSFYKLPVAQFLCFV